MWGGSVNNRVAGRKGSRSRWVFPKCTKFVLAYTTLRFLNLQCIEKCGGQDHLSVRSQPSANASDCHVRDVSLPRETLPSTFARGRGQSPFIYSFSVISSSSKGFIRALPVYEDLLLRHNVLVMLQETFDRDFVEASFICDLFCFRAKLWLILYVFGVCFLLRCSVIAFSVRCNS